MCLADALVTVMYYFDIQLGWWLYWSYRYSDCNLSDSC